MSETEHLHFMRLWDAYNPLLTETQRRITDLYFNCDLSLGEIAEQLGCTRQGVSDCLNKCRKRLESYEEKLHFLRVLAESQLTLSFFMTDVSRWAERAKENPAFQEPLKELEELLNHDYTEEVAEAIKKNPDTLL